jgi:hypothetical protein
MEKKHPVFIEHLSKDIEVARDLEKKALADAEHFKKEWLRLYYERQEQCPHKYADGTSAWKDHWALGACDICGYSDL